MRSNVILFNYIVSSYKCTVMLFKMFQYMYLSFDMKQFIDECIMLFLMSNTYLNNTSERWNWLYTSNFQHG